MRSLVFIYMMIAGGGAFAQIEEIDQRKMPREVCYSFHMSITDPENIASRREVEAPDICLDVAKLFQKDAMKCSDEWDVITCSDERHDSIDISVGSYRFNTVARSRYEIQPKAISSDTGVTVYAFMTGITLMTNWEYRLSNILMDFKKSNGFPLESLVLPGNTELFVGFLVEWQDGFPTVNPVRPRKFTNPFGFPSAFDDVGNESYATGFDANNKVYDVTIVTKLKGIKYQDGK
ncbi:MAG: hypothetical protein AB7T49_05990 [Oligoflexales bacterium]